MKINNSLWNGVATRQLGWVGVILMFLFLTTGCGSSGGDRGGGGGAPPETGTVSGIVFSAKTGAAVPGATIRAGSTTVTSAVDGAYILTADVGRRVVIHVEAAGFAETFQIARVTVGKTSPLDVQLLPIGVAEVINVGAGGTVSVPNTNAQISIPAGGLVPAAGGAPAASVNVAVTPINPAINPDIMPGDFTAVLAGDSVPVAIESFGALRVDVRDDTGARYTLRAGQSATVRIPVGTLSDTPPPATIPLLIFNESTGRWDQEGEATLAGSAPDQFYVGTVQRFGAWNADKPMLTVVVSGCVRDTANQQVENVTVISSGINYSGTGSTFTDANGNFSVRMRRDGLATISVTFNRNGKPVVTTVNVGPFATDTTLTDCIVTEPVPLSMIARTLPSGIVGKAYNARLAAANGTKPYTWSVTAGALPTGLTLDSVTGQVSGTPTAAGVFTGTIQVQDSSSPAQSAETSFFINILAPPPFGIATLSLPAGIVGTAYNATLIASNGTQPYAWSVTSGNLPTGLTLSANGQISGTPTSGGSFTFTIQAQDSAAPVQSATAVLSIFIGGGIGGGPTPPPAPTGVGAFSGDTQVRIIWNAVAGADSYNLYMASVTGVSKSNYTTLADGMKHSNVTSPFIKTGLTNGTTYYFVVTAVNAVGESVESLQVSATPVPDTGGTSDVSTLSAGVFHSCARLGNGTVRCWGYNAYGALGNGTFISSTTPVQVSGITTATAISAKYLQSCALLGNGTVQCWGHNGFGALGNGTFISSTTPVQVSGITTATAVSTGVYNTCAVLSNGTVQCWGNNVFGQLGNGTFTSSTTPVQVSGITTATAVSVGAGYSCALLGNGTVQCWGTNGSGQLGNGTVTFSSAIPVQVSGITTATAVSAGSTHSCARLGNGTVQCWGINSSGQLGNGTTTSSTTPVQVSGITTATSVAAADYPGSHSCARLGNGTVQCWGTNGSGQLGNGTVTFSSAIPVQVSGITTATAVSAGSTHTCAGFPNGTVQCWGANSFGQLGNGTNTSSTTPVQVSGLP